MLDIVTNVLYQGIDRLQEKVKELEDENRRLREALDLVISFIPDGWGMPLGFNQVAQQAREALRKTKQKQWVTVIFAVPFFYDFWTH